MVTQNYDISAGELLKRVALRSRIMTEYSDVFGVSGSATRKIKSTGFPKGDGEMDGQWVVFSSVLAENIFLIDDSESAEDSSTQTLTLGPAYSLGFDTDDSFSVQVWDAEFPPEMVRAMLVGVVQQIGSVYRLPVQDTSHEAVYTVQAYSTPLDMVEIYSVEYQLGSDFWVELDTNQWRTSRDDQTLILTPQTAAQVTGRNLRINGGKLPHGGLTVAGLRNSTTLEVPADWAEALMLTQIFESLAQGENAQQYTRAASLQSAYGDQLRRRAVTRRSIVRRVR